MQAESAKKNLIDDIEQFNQIDSLTSVEIADGEGDEQNNSNPDQQETDGDGVDLSIIGSDFEDDDFDSVEMGSIMEEDNNNQQRKAVTSKVVMVNRDKNFNSPSRSRSHSRSRSQSKGGSFGKFKHLKDDPDFREFLKEMIDGHDNCDNSRRRRSHRRSRSRSQSRGCSQHSKHKHGSSRQCSRDKSDRSEARSRKGSVEKLDRNFPVEPIHVQVTDKTVTPVTKDKGQLVKSPSDTTLYLPGLHKANNEDVSLIEKISNFVESIRLDSNRNALRKDKGRDSCAPSTSRKGDYRRVDQQELPHSGKYVADRYSDPDLVADQLIMQAEKFKARVEAPKGNFTNYSDMLMPYGYEKLRSKFVKPEGLGPIDREIMFLRNFDQDDEFFHVTSQIEPSLRVKIERGEFVELERLLPKDRALGGRNEDLNKQLYQLITQGTNNFIDPPVPKTGKINSIRKWNQAFRVYAAIYTNANPERASEIWQYVYVIHTAAAANHWDNVYLYDINIHELMASKPWRSLG